MTELVFLHGAPASGKLTVAKALLGMLTGRLLDNHAAIDFARTVFDFGAPGFWHLVHAVRLAALSTAVEHDVPLVVATSCYSEPEDRTRFEEFRAVVERGGGRIAPVFLHCPDEEARRRIGNPDRVQRRKITSVEGWERFTARWTMAPVPQPDCLMINTGQHAPEIAAQEIVRHFALNQTDLAVDGSATVFDVASCRAAARAGHLEDWLHRYLRSGPWANLGLSDGLRRCPRNWIGPVLLRLNALERCCGPEPEMEYRENAETWHCRVSVMAAGLTDPTTLPPLIVEWKTGRLSVRDGSHRHAAATRAGWPALWAVVWFSDPAQGRAVELAVAQAVACTARGSGTTLADTCPSDKDVGPVGRTGDAPHR